MNRSINLTLALIVLLTLCLSFQVIADDAIKHLGRVIKVVDGDSITILVDRQQIKIRLAEIDTPERGQPYWRVSRKALEDLVAGKEVLAKQIDIDRYKRVVAHVYINDIWVNEDLVKHGHAHVYPKYAKSQSLYDAQKFSQENRLGLWSLPESERVPPWVWRKRK